MRGKCESGRKKGNYILSTQIKVREKKRNDTFANSEEGIKK